MKAQKTEAQTRRISFYTFLFIPISILSCPHFLFHISVIFWQREGTLTFSKRENGKSN